MSTTKPNVLFMVQLPPPTHGPALRNQTLVKSAIISEKIDIDILPMQFSDSIAQIGKFSLTKYWRVVIHLYKLILKVTLLRPDMVYFTISPIGGSFLRDCLFVFVLKTFRIKRIFHLRGLGISDWYNRSVLHKFFYPWAFRNSFVVLLSEGHKSDMCFSGYKNLYIVPNGIEDAGMVTIHKNNVHQFHLLYFSNLVTSKGVLVFVDAVRILIERGYPVVATICGENGDLTVVDVYNYICKNKLEHVISLKQGIFEIEKFKLMSDCDIFVFPTYLELFPGVVLEAMQCGKAIVSTTTGAIPEIIDNDINGLLTSSQNDPFAIAERIVEYLNNPELIALHGTLARKKYEQYYRADIFEHNMSKMFMDVYSSN